MRKRVATRLLDINREFYQSFAEPFRATRGRLQPGVEFALESVDVDADVLDLGCAHGTLAEFLQQRGHAGRYVGLDSSSSLLESVSEQLRPPQFQFVHADLSEADWVKRAASPTAGDDKPEKAPEQALFDWVFAFSVLHHMPTHELRQSISAALKDLLNSNGRVVVSVWDFLASPRLQDRIVAWKSVDLSEEQVERGDYLIDWREGGSGVRYVHHFSSDELSQLAREAGFWVSEEYRSDGENSQLGLYQIWTKPD